MTTLAIIQLLLAKGFLGALGNVLVGTDKVKSSNAWGYGFMAIAVWLGIESPYWLPAILAGLFVWRSHSPQAWLTMTHTPDWLAGIKRGLTISPLAIFIPYAAGNPWLAFYGLALIPLPAIIYYIAGNLRPNNPVPYAEVVTGAFLGLL